MIHRYYALLSTWEQLQSPRIGFTARKCLQPLDTGESYDTTDLRSNSSLPHTWNMGLLWRIGLGMKLELMSLMGCRQYQLCGSSPTNTTTTTTSQVLRLDWSSEATNLPPNIKIPTLRP